MKSLSSRPRGAWVVMVFFVAGAGCDEPPAKPQVGQNPIDSGVMLDGNRSDGALPDVSPSDSGPADAAPPDVQVDAGPVDSAIPDARGGRDAAPLAPDQGPTRPDGPISGSYINEMRFETSEDGGEDIDGDGDTDNRLGVLLESVRIFAPDLDANIKLRTAIGDGCGRGAAVRPQPSPQFPVAFGAADSERGGARRLQR